MLKKKFNELDQDKKLYIVLGCFVFMILFVLLVPNNKKKEPSINNHIISNIIGDIKDNYTMDISVNNSHLLKYKTDGVISIFERDKTYIKYKNSYYDIESYKKLDNYKEEDNLYYDIDFIKSIVKYCNYKDESNTKVICTMKVSDYVNERNKKENLSYKITDDKYISFEFIYSTVLTEINVDYTYVNKIINNSDENKVYNIKISDIKMNDFSEILTNISSNVESNETN